MEVVKKLNLAFLYALNDDYETSYDMYNSVRQKEELKREEWLTIENVNRFINDRLDNDPTNERLMYCSAIVNIMFKDSILGIKEMDKLSKENVRINRIYKKIKDNN